MTSPCQKGPAPVTLLEECVTVGGVLHWAASKKVKVTVKEKAKVVVKVKGKGKVKVKVKLKVGL
jgi:hypothetical protein